MNKKQIPIEHIISLHEQRKKINNLQLDDIEFTENGKPLQISLDIIREFKYTGLNNMDFILSGFYEKGWDE